jgi:hypothetical protein
VFDSAGEVKVGPPIAGSFLLMGKMKPLRQWFRDFLPFSLMALQQTKRVFVCLFNDASKLRRLHNDEREG